MLLDPFLSASQEAKFDLLDGYPFFNFQVGQKMQVFIFGKENKVLPLLLFHSWGRDDEIIVDGAMAITRLS